MMRNSSNINGYNNVASPPSTNSKDYRQELRRVIERGIQDVVNETSEFDEVIRAELATVKACEVSCGGDSIWGDNEALEEIILNWTPLLKFMKATIQVAKNNIKEMHSNNRRFNDSRDSNNSVVPNATKESTPKIINKKPVSPLVTDPKTGAISKGHSSNAPNPINGAVSYEPERLAKSFHDVKKQQDSIKSGHTTNPPKPTVSGHGINSRCYSDYVAELQVIEPSKITPQANEQTPRSHECVIKSIKPIPINASDVFVAGICHILSPSEFYVHQERHKDIRNELDELLSNPVKRGTLTAAKIFKGTESELIGTFWICKFQDDRYYRVRICSKSVPRKDKEIYKIQYIDWGNCEDVSLDKLFVMAPKISQFPALAIKCKLHNIEPIDENGWTQEDNDFLENACDYSLEKFWIDVRVKKLLPDLFGTYNAVAEVELINLDDVTGTTINDRFVENGRGAEEGSTPCKKMLENGSTNQVNGNTASLSTKSLRSELNPIKAPSTYHTAPSKSGSVRSSGSSKKLGLIRTAKPRTAEQAMQKLVKNFEPHFPEENEWDDDDLEDEHIMNGNAFGTEMDDPMMAAVGFKTKEVDYCRFYAKGRCHKGQYCPYKHIELEDLKGMVYNCEEETTLDIKPQEPLIKDAVYLIQVIRVDNIHVRVALPLGPEPLTKNTFNKVSDQKATSYEQQYAILRRDMKEKYSKQEFQEQQNIYPNIGSLVAVRGDVFIRAKVIECFPEKDIIHVKCLDAGNNMKVPRGSVYKLHSEFTLLPSFTYVARLEGVGNRSQIENLMKLRAKLGVKVIDIDDVTGDDIPTLKMVNLTKIFL